MSNSVNSSLKTIPLEEWQRRMRDGTLGSYLQDETSLAEIESAQQLNALAQYQQSLPNTSLAQYQNTAGQLSANYLSAALSQPSANPYLSAERLGDFRESRRDLLREDGGKIIARMAFWQEIPVVGGCMASRLADRLDKISDRIEELA